MHPFAFRYGNLEMSNLSAVAIALTGVVSIVFFVVASLNTDTKGLIDSSVENLAMTSSLRLQSSG
jgi:hypothetical protein